MTANPAVEPLLPLFAEALLRDHVPALAAENLHLLREMEVPLLRAVAPLDEAQLLQLTEAGM